MIKALTLIIPFYGKNYSDIKMNLIRNLKIAKENNVDVIITYKTDEKGEKYDYSSIEEDFCKFDNVKLIKNPKEFLRTSKIIKAIESSHSKYSQIMDCHHKINAVEFEKFCKYIENLDYDYLISKYKKVDLDLDVTVEYQWGQSGFSFGAGSSTYKTSVLKECVKEIDYDIIYMDDWTYSLHMIKQILEMKKEFKPHFTNFSWYERIQGNQISTTSKRNDIEIANHLWNNLDFAYSFLNEIDVNEISENILTAISAIENGYFLLNGGDINKLLQNPGRINLVKKYGKIMELDGKKRF